MQTFSPYPTVHLLCESSFFDSSTYRVNDTQAFVKRHPLRKSQNGVNVMTGSLDSVVFGYLHIFLRQIYSKPVGYRS